MKILFVCKSNVGRSQMAESIFNKLTKKHISKSAGVSPGKWEGKKLIEAKHVLPSLKEIDIDAKENTSKKITKEFVDWSEKVIVIGVDSEIWPDYLKESKKVEFWDVKDMAYTDLEGHREGRDEIKKRIIKLIESLNN